MKNPGGEPIDRVKRESERRLVEAERLDRRTARCLAGSQAALKRSFELLARTARLLDGR